MGVFYIFFIKELWRLNCPCPHFHHNHDIIILHVQVPVGNYDIFLCFGAVVPDGYGVCYNPQEKQVIFSVSSFHSCPETDSLRFLGKLTETMTEMHAVLTASKGLNAKL